MFIENEMDFQFRTKIFKYENIKNSDFFIFTSRQDNDDSISQQVIPDMKDALLLKIL
ncbi:hypothetical protein [Malaciobacter molluscorum]|uniref:hypothetical protein n=1 Tax=Malaciobacter molluscorum TaxID=1032072 RepID=UPI0013EC4905|nr:hypothetical protein [Malaciobacter molluscorum]